MTTTILSRGAIDDRRPFFALLSANAVSLAGNVLAALAIPWFVLETTGSAARMGVVGFFTLLPTVLGTFFGGALVDRLGHKRVSVAADILSGIMVALIPLLHQTVGIAFWQLLVLVFFGALLDAPGVTARTALFPEVVERGGLRMERASAAYQGVQRLSELIGPAAAGVLIALMGSSTVLWFNAASFAVSAALVAAAIPPANIRARQESSYVDDLREGLTFVRQHRLVRVLVISIAITNLLDAALVAVVMPVFVKTTYGGAETLGLLFAAFGAGAVAGSILFGTAGARLPRRPTYVVGFLVCGLTLWALPLAPSLAILVAVQVVRGIACSPLNPILMVIFQERIPPEMRGRVAGAISAGVLVAAPIGVLSAGYVIEVVGLTPMIVVIASLYLVTTMSLAFSAALREMDERADARSVAAR